MMSLGLNKGLPKYLWKRGWEGILLRQGRLCSLCNIELMPDELPHTDHYWYRVLVRSRKAIGVAVTPARRRRRAEPDCQ